MWRNERRGEGLKAVWESLRRGHVCVCLCGQEADLYLGVGVACVYACMYAYGMCGGTRS